MEAKTKEQLTLAKELPKDFLVKKVYDAAQKCLTDNGHWNDVDLRYWTGLLHIRFIIETIGYDKVVAKHKEYIESLAFYNTLKQ